MSAAISSAGLTSAADELRAFTGASGVVLVAASGDEVRSGCSGLTLPSGGAVPGTVPAPVGAPAAAPVTLRTAFDLASITKALATTACLMRLVSERLVDLDDRVTAHVPPFSGGVKEAVTIRDLLLHRGGLQPWWPLYFTARDRGAALHGAAELPLAGKPRSQRVYSDLGFIVLGAVVESVAGQALDAAARDLVFAPLGLSSTGYRPSLGAVAVESGGAAADGAAAVAASAFGDRAERAMVGAGVPYPVPFSPGDFDGWRTSLLVGEANDGNAFHSFGGVAGHAGLFSTSAELLCFARALASIEQHEHLFAPDVAQDFFASGPDVGQSLGFRRYELDLPAEAFEPGVTPEPGRDSEHAPGGDSEHATGGSLRVTALGHPGFTGTAFGFVPGTGLAFVVATNRLLAAGEPVSNDAIWARASAAWAAELRAMRDGAPPTLMPSASGCSAPPPKEG